MFRLLLMSLMVLLPSSSFFWPEYLQHVLLTTDKHNEISQNKLNLALKIGLPQAYSYVFQHSKKYSQTWFYYGYKLAQQQPEIAFDLGEYFKKKNLHQAKLWYETAIKQQYVPAVIALAKLYQHQKQYVLAKCLLSDFLAEPACFNLLLTLAVDTGDLNLLKQLTNTLTNQASRLDQSSLSLLDELKEFYIHSSLFYQHESQTKLNALIKGATCENSIEVFATTLRGLRLVKKWINEFQLHPLARSVCFSAPQYVPSTMLACNHQHNAPISCNETIWKKHRHFIHSKYLLVVVAKGGANVDAGITYLDNYDNTDVFAHEISHLLGFIDEYPLRKGHQVCQQDHFKGLNLAILNQRYSGEQDRNQLRANVLSSIPWGRFVLPSTPIMQRKENKWVLGTPVPQKGTVGLFVAKTCQNNNKVAFKPLYKTTQLEYFETQFPLLYLTLFQHNNKFQMPSFKARWHHLE